MVRTNHDPTTPPQLPEITLALKPLDIDPANLVAMRHPSVSGWRWAAYECHNFDSGWIFCQRSFLPFGPAAVNYDPPKFHSPTGNASDQGVFIGEVDLEKGVIQGIYESPEDRRKRENREHGDKVRERLLSRWGEAVRHRWTAAELEAMPTIRREERDQYSCVGGSIKILTDDLRVTLVDPVPEEPEAERIILVERFYSIFHEFRSYEITDHYRDLGDGTFRTLEHMIPYWGE